MPLPRQLFDWGISLNCERTMRLVYEFLAENRELAYSQEEIQEEFGGAEELEEALRLLVNIFAVKKRDIGGTNYFTLLHEFDTGTWLSKRHLAG